MKKIYPIIIFVVIYLVLAFATYKYFGITTDEFSAYVSGDIWFHHFINEPSYYDYLSRFNPLTNEHYRFYSVLLYMLVGSLNYEKYHLWNILLTLPLFIAAYFAVLKAYKSRMAAIVSTVFIFLTPRFIGSIAADPKDIPFAVAYFISVLLIFFWKDAGDTKYRLLKIMILGLIFGYTQSIRAAGFGLFFIYLVARLSSEKKNRIKEIQQYLSETILIFLVSVSFMAATWPAIGSNFFSNFKKYLFLSSSFSLWEGSTLLGGKSYDAGSIPWFYLPVWLFVTTPVVYLILTIGGFGMLAARKLSKLGIFVGSVLLFNLFLYFAVTPVSYNGVRHYLYLVVLISLFSGIVLFELSKLLKRNSYTAILTITLVYTCLTIYKAIILHPYEYLYFNEFAGSFNSAAKYYDMDYWATSAKSAADYIKQDSVSLNRRSKYYTCINGLALSYYLNDTADETGKINQADYIVCTPGSAKTKGIPGPPIFIESRFSVPLVEVYKAHF